MSGIVNAPVVTALAMALPFTMPNSPLEITATFPAPPRVVPARASARSVKKPSKPPWSMTAPKSTNRKMKLVETSVGMPKTPSVVSICRSTNFSPVTPPWPRKPGSQGPMKA